MGLGQKKGFRHSAESKAKISAAFKGGPPRGGFAIRVVCPGCGREMNAANLARHKPVCDKFGNYTAKRKSLKRRLHLVGLELDEYDRLVRKQKGKCAICGGKPTGKRKSLDVDHCHSRNVFRGLLCSPCNIGLGHFKDDPKLFIRALEYLNKFNDRR